MWKYSQYHSGKGFWKFSEIFWVSIERKSWIFHEILWQVCDIYWNISRNLPIKLLETSQTKSCRNFSAKFLEIFRTWSRNFVINMLRKLLVKILEILDKILQKLFSKVSRNIQISVTKLLNQYFHNLAEIFSERLQVMLRKDSHYHYREGFWNFSEIFCVWFVQRRQIFNEMCCQVWSNIYWNISGKLPVKIPETSHKILPKHFCKVYRYIHNLKSKFLNQYLTKAFC